MDESTLRELAEELHANLQGVIEDPQERRRAATEIEAALAEPEGHGRAKLLRVLRARPETRVWVEARIGADEFDVVRTIPGLPGGPTTPVGVHVVCPNGHYDRYLETPTDDPGHCPYDGLRLVRADD